MSDRAHNPNRRIAPTVSRDQFDAVRRERDRLLDAIATHGRWWSDAHIFSGPEDAMRQKQVWDQELYGVADGMRQAATQDQEKPIERQLLDWLDGNHDVD